MFLEPEGRHSPEVYVQGFSTGLPERLQLALLHTLPGAQRGTLVCHTLNYTWKHTMPSCTAGQSAGSSCE